MRERVNNPVRYSKNPFLPWELVQKDTLPVTEVNLPMYDPSQKSPEPVVMKQFLPKEGDLRRGWEGAKKLLNQLVAFVLFINMFL